MHKGRKSEAAHKALRCQNVPRYYCDYQRRAAGEADKERSDPGAARLQPPSFLRKESCHYP